MAYWVLLLTWRKEWVVIAIGSLLLFTALWGVWIYNGWVFGLTQGGVRVMMAQLWHSSPCASG